MTAPPYCTELDERPVELSALGERRNHAVPCDRCRKPTVNYYRVCTPCKALVNQEGPTR